MLTRASIANSVLSERFSRWIAAMSGDGAETFLMTTQSGMLCLAFLVSFGCN